MRELRRMDRKLSDEAALKVLRESEYGFLATVNEDGSPYVVPMAGALAADGRTLYFHCARAGQKLDNLARDARACYTCVLYAHNQPAEFTQVYASCVAEGRVRRVTDEAERLRGMAAIMEKYSAEYIGTPGYEKTMKGMPAVVMLALEVQALQGKGNRGRLTEESAGAS